MLFNQQKGICWICNLPMKPPLPPDECRNRNGDIVWQATIDHTEKKQNPPRMRDAKAAHAKCNHHRHHYSLNNKKVRAIVKAMHAAYEHQTFVIFTTLLVPNLQSTKGTVKL